ncbi:Aste57867_10918 [Aphanomyces stellatus]|uniref:Aste57867_10918 protein n=1 Tax=Aphanomyces stellatus TaxID=120398 RepID=A0A485KT95_9STRA|nr:hypothetical protein As57867_010878 [Aphanomyces stellatus]VFT87786.1 Aste57867_10918 [Aphanomyces stellatus]
MAVDGIQTNNNVHCECFLMDKDGRQLRGGVKFKTKSIKATANPMYNLACDFGMVSLDAIGGLVVSIKHTGSLGLKSCELGEVVLTSVDLVNMKMKSDAEEWYYVGATPEMAQKGWTNRPLGEVRLSYMQHPGGLGGTRPTSTSIDEVPVAASSASHLTSNSPILKLTSTRTISAVDMVQHDPRAELAMLKKFATRYPQRGETWFAVSSAWVMQWLSFVADASKQTAAATSDDSALFPGEINNMVLMDDELRGGFLQVRDDVTLIVDFRLVDPETWKLYKAWYGGGPTISVRIPDGIPSVSGWMKTMSLKNEGQILAS